MTIGCISTSLPAGGRQTQGMRAAQQNSLATVKIPVILSQLPPTTCFLSTRECYTRGLPRVLREAQHFFRQWTAT
jgi:hypothetical protein